MTYQWFLRIGARHSHSVNHFHTATSKLSTESSPILILETVKKHNTLCHSCLAYVFVECWNPCSVLRQTAPLTAVTAALVKAHGTAVLQTLAMAISLRMAACVMKRHDVELSLPSEFITVKSGSLTHWMKKHVLHIAWALTGVSLVDRTVCLCTAISMVLGSRWLSSSHTHIFIDLSWIV